MNLRLRWTPRLAVAGMLVTVGIYGSNFVVARYATLHGLTSGDLTALRFVFAAPFVLPLFLRQGFASCGGVGWRRGLVLAVTGGAPMSLLTNTGFLYAPAAHGAALAPGTVTLVGVVAGAILVGALPPALTIAGLCLVGTGLATIAIAGSGAAASQAIWGDLCFVTAGFIWGFYPILLHRWRVGAFAGAAVAVVLSLPYAILHLAPRLPHLLTLDPWFVLGQGLFQGVLAMIVGLWLWGSAVRLLGAARTQLFPPLIPVIGTLMAIPTLGEIPGPAQSVAILLIVAGLGLAAWGNRRASRLAAAATTGPETRP